MRERGTPYRQWDHRMSVVELGGTSCRFVDSIEVVGRPAALTPLVWAAAQQLCRSRMKRLIELGRVIAAM